VADGLCGPIRSATQTGLDSISYKWQEGKMISGVPIDHLVFQNFGIEKN